MIDLWFVVRGDLDGLDPVEMAQQSSGKAVEAGNMRFESRLLTDDELKPHGRSSQRSRDFARWFVHLKGRLLDRIAVEATDEAVATRTEESMVIAGRTDPAFDSEQDAGKPVVDSRSGWSKRTRAAVPRRPELRQDQPPEGTRRLPAGRVPRGLQRAGGVVPGVRRSCARNSHRSPRTRFESSAESCSRTARSRLRPRRALLRRRAGQSGGSTQPQGLGSFSPPDGVGFGIQAHRLQVITTIAALASFHVFHAELALATVLNCSRPWITK